MSKKRTNTVQANKYKKWEKIERQRGLIMVKQKVVTYLPFSYQLGRHILLGEK